MSILSKIFTVVLVVLSIAVAVSTIIIQRDVLEPKAKLLHVTQQLQEVELAKTTVETEMTRERDVVVRRNQDLIREVGDRDEQIKRKETEVGGLTAQLAEVQKQLAGAQLDLATWTGIATRTDGERKAAEAKAEKFKTDFQDSIRKYTHSEQKLAEAAAQRDFLLQQVAMLKEQIAVLQERLNNQAASLTTANAASGDVIRPIAAGPTIKGKVLKVADNMTMATIDVGANDGVQPDMQFDVYNQGKFLAELIITDVHAKMAVGRLQKVQNPVQEGYRVSNNLAAN